VKGENVVVEIQVELVVVAHGPVFRASSGAAANARHVPPGNI